MKLLFAALVAFTGLLATACESTTEYDGTSRFAGGGVYQPFYGPGSVPRDTGASSHTT